MKKPTPPRRDFTVQNIHDFMLELKKIDVPNSELPMRVARVFEIPREEAEQIVKRWLRP